MSDRRSLDVIQVSNPCPADWEQMAGDEKHRFCSHCNKWVHDLSAMPRVEAERMVCQAAGSLCVRFARDAQTGEVLTLDYAPKPLSSRRRALATIASIGAALLCAGTLGAIRLRRKPAVPAAPRLLGEMGDIVCPPPAPANPAAVK
jgi:hypothetical protein